MLKLALSLAALMILLPSTSHAMSKKPPKNQQVGGSDRPVVVAAPTPYPQSKDCAAAKEYAKGLRAEATKSLNSYVTQASSKYTQLEINFYNCRQNYAQEALTVAEVSVCGGYTSQAALKDKVAANLQKCDNARASEKQQIAGGLKPVKDSMPIILTTPDYQPQVQAPAGVSSEGLSSTASKAARAKSVQ